MQNGAATVEFALVLVFMLLLAGGIVEFGRIFWYYNAMAKATRDGARYLAGSPSLDTAGAAALARAEAGSAGVPSADFSVSVRCDGGTCPNPSSGGYVAPTYVTVGIDLSGSSGTIGAWMPIFLPEGGITSFALALSPSTTMRYLGE